MNKAKEILEALTPAQRTEFEKDLQAIGEVVLQHYDGSPDKVAETNVNMRLQNSI